MSDFDDFTDFTDFTLGSSCGQAKLLNLQFAQAPQKGLLPH
jgi:hypothetical protein